MAGPEILKKDEVSKQPKLNNASYEPVFEHGNKFAFITLNDTKTGKQNPVGGDNLNSPKFSIYVGNGREPLKNPSNSNEILIFNSQEDDQKTVAAQFHVTSYTDLVTTNIAPSPAAPLRGRSAIKGRADVVELNANEMVVITSGARSRNSYDNKIWEPGGVHLYAGDRTGAGADPAQPMVLGNNLKKTLDEMQEKLQSLSRDVMDLNTHLFDLEFTMMLHTHIGALGPVAPSIELAVSIPVNMIVSGIKRLINAFIDMLNEWIQKIIRLFPISKGYILSSFHTVN